MSVESILKGIAAVILLMVLFSMLSIVLKVGTVLLGIALRVLFLLLVAAIVLRLVTVFLRNRS